MLILGDKQITRQQAAEKFGFDLKKLEKYPAFEIYKDRKWRDKANGNVIKSGAGMSFRSHFVIEDPQTGLKEIFRYAKSRGTKTVGNQLKEVFEPREVRFMGMKNEFRNDLDLAVFYMLRPETEDSPVRKMMNVIDKPKISYIDKQKRASDRISGVNMVAQAMTHVNSLSDEEITILAKGLGFKNVDRTEPESVKADVLEFALKSPKVYLEQSASQLTLIKGKIHHMVDSQIFKMEKIGNVRKWKWAAGVNEGGTIVDIINQTVDAREALINHIFSHINDYLPAIQNMTDSLNARQVAERALKSKEEIIEAAPNQQVIGEALPDHLKSVNQDQDSLPTNFKEAIEYLTKKNGVRPSNVVASNFLKSLQ